MRIPSAGSVLMVIGDILKATDETRDSASHAAERMRFVRFLCGVGAVLASDDTSDRVAVLAALEDVRRLAERADDSTGHRDAIKQIKEAVSNRDLDPWAGIAEALEYLDERQLSSTDDGRAPLYRALDRLLERARTDVLDGGTRVYPDLEIARTNPNYASKMGGIEMQPENIAKGRSPDGLSERAVTELTAIERLFESHLGPGHIVDARVLSDGGRRRTLSVEYVPASGTAGTRHVVRIAQSPDNGPIEQSLRTEHALLGSLQDTSIPVESPCWFVDAPLSLPGPVLVTRWINGDTSTGEQTRAVLQADWSEDRTLCRQYVRTLGEIHGVATDSLPLSAEPPADTVERELAAWQTLYETVRFERYPVVEDGFRWLAANAPQLSEQRLVHGDYVSRNLVFDDRSIVGILDWESARLSDPMFDLGFVTCPVFAKNSFELETANEPALGVINREWLFDRYEDYTGRTVDRDRVRYWRTFVVVTMLCVALRNYRQFIDESSTGARQLLALFDTVPERQFLLQRIFPNQ